MKKALSILLMLYCTTTAAVDTDERMSFMFLSGAYNGCILANGMHPSITTNITPRMMDDICKRCSGLMINMPGYTKLSPRNQEKFNTMMEEFRKQNASTSGR